MKIFLNYVHKPDGKIRRKGLLSSMEGHRVKADCHFTKFGVATEDIVSICKDRQVPVRLFLPHQGVLGGKKIPVIIFFHGGGFCYNSAFGGTYDIYCRRIASSTNSLVISVGYRLAPENRYPAAYEDGISAVEWLKEKAQRQSAWIQEYADLKNCFLAGDSAGGNLAHHVSLFYRGSNLEHLYIRGRILICPFFGGKIRLPSEILFSNGHVTNEKICSLLWKSFLPEGSDMDHFAANPISPSHPPLDGLPTTLVQVDGLDYLRDRAILYVEALRSSNVPVEFLEYKDSIHDGALFGQKPQRLLADINSFVQKYVQ